MGNGEKRKRTVSILAVMVLAALCLFVQNGKTAQAAGGKLQMQAGVVLGDVNGDGKCTLSDAVGLLDAVTGEQEGLPEEYDFNGDGKVDLTDALKLLDLLVREGGAIVIPEETAKVRFVCEADSVGLGTLISETVEVPEGYSLEQFLKERLIAHGYSYSMIGMGHFRKITKKGMMSSWSISDSEKARLKSEKVELDETLFDPDSLGDYHFTEMSGWMIFKDRYYIGGIGKLHDGDEILMKYSLNYDRDVKDILGE